MKIQIDYIEKQILIEDRMEGMPEKYVKELLKLKKAGFSNFDVVSLALPLFGASEYDMTYIHPTDKKSDYYKTYKKYKVGNPHFNMAYSSIDAYIKENQNEDK